MTRCWTQHHHAPAHAPASDPEGWDVHLVCCAGPITCFKVQSAGRFVASGDCKGGLKLWSLVEGVQLDVREGAHSTACSAVAFLEPHLVGWTCAQRNYFATFL